MPFVALAAAAAAGGGSGLDEPPEGCWSGLARPKLCCDLRHGPTGLQECWDDEFTYDLCCGPLLRREKSRSDPSVGQAVAAAATATTPSSESAEKSKKTSSPEPQKASKKTSPPEPQKGKVVTDAAATAGRSSTAPASPEQHARGAGPYSAQGLDLSPFGDPNCWLLTNTDVMSPAFCCNTKHGPQGFPDCFGAAFTFQRCCVKQDKAPLTTGKKSEEKVGSSTAKASADAQKQLPSKPNPDPKIAQTKGQVEIDAGGRAKGVDASSTGKSFEEQAEEWELATMMAEARAKSAEERAESLQIQLNAALKENTELQAKAEAQKTFCQRKLKSCKAN